MKLRNSLLAVVAVALCAAPASAGPQLPSGWKPTATSSRTASASTTGAPAATSRRSWRWHKDQSDDGLCWTNLAREFQGQYDIIMFDARGHGLSNPPSPSDPPDVQVEDLAGLIKELKLGRPILMGHSMGSSSVARFAAAISGRGAGRHSGSPDWFVWRRRRQEPPRRRRSSAA